MSAILDVCEGLPRVTFNDGDQIIGEGEQGNRMYVLIDGEVIVEKGGTEVARDGPPGSLFGEMSALLETPFSATVRADGNVRMYLVTDPIEFLVTRPGIAVHSARLLAQRLHDATTYLADLKTQFQENSDHFGMMDQILDALLHQQRRKTEDAFENPEDPRL